MLIRGPTNTRVFAPLMSYIQVPIKKSLKDTFSMPLQSLIFHVNW